MFKDLKVLGLTIIAIIIIMVVLSNWKKERLEKYGMESTAFVLDIYTRKKGRTTTSTLALIKYKTHVGWVEEEVPARIMMEIGKCYKVIYDSLHVNRLEFYDDVERVCDF